MKDIKLGNDVKTWILVGALAFMVLIAILVADQLIPTPSVVGARKASSEKERELTKEYKTKLEKYEASKTVIAASAWGGAAERVSPAILDRLTKIASIKGLKIQSFRPQKIQDAADLEVLAYNLSIEGPFPNVMSFIQLVEKQEKKLAVTLVQVASADGETDEVNASLGISAFVIPEKEAPVGKS